MNVLYGVYPQLIENWDQEFIENIYSAIDLCKAKKLLKAGDRIMLVNDIRKGGKEIPLVELMEIT
jgi:pyruvate kinase